MSKYTKDHFVMAKRVLRYLQGTRDYGLLWKKPSCPDFHFTAYADADLGSEKDDRRSITGFVLQMNGCTYAYRTTSSLSPMLTPAVLSLLLPLSVL
ncbi:hypothetical protein PF005_g19546 [Phytophthora fragariae]|uniref:Reverse transcriptase Ty1/copia-type domain-containing protein n=1 Tax=Phytophthora fragariae TaxID=53985 RepID=A0A6A3EES2_9STRA|nr:hypothetical protein PF009_g17866 [Phytophthora fragariae]KAE8996440.1 hypothetical protein PF011_g15902 [Phytophthora fragariae]KAE9092558.1 hypothetical protein PF010_g17803 [Phytophthora fragariae]KAE9096895.1 hypothetical protein PF007_g16813 [Phytophthora fragariae]KAE9131100.1 hypothetical protein PF006_g15606 [Phytophthora fragariae]